MTPQETLDRALAKLTPAHLCTLVEEIAQTQAPDDRNAVNIDPIIEALTGVKEIGSGVQAWEAYLALKRAIRQTADQAPGLSYVEVES